MNRPTYIFGHVNPDTDSICSAIAYCRLKKELGDENVEVYRLGSITKETEFALDFFGVSVPGLLKDVKPQLADLQYYRPITVSKDTSIKKTWEIIKSSSIGSNTRVVAIVNADGGLEGIATINDIARVLMEKIEDTLDKYQVSYENVLEVTEGTVIHGKPPSEFVKGRFMLDSQIESIDVRNDDVIIVTNSESIKAYAGKCAALIIPENKITAPSNAADCYVIAAKYSVYTVVNVISKAITIGSVMKTKGIESFTLDNYIEDVIDATKNSAHRNFPVLDKDERLAGIISRRHLIDYQRKKVILIDHNERHQSVDGIEHADIIEIIDHHRVANVQTLSPLFIRSEPVGSTATIIFKMYMENFLRPPKEIAGIMLSAVLSDTLMFNSPTCTKEDREAAYKLAKIAGVDLDDYGEILFKTSNFDEYTEDEILAIDRKEFTFGKYMVCISQANTIEFASLAKRHDALLAVMSNFKETHKYDMVILMLTDIINTGSEIMGVASKPDILDRAFGIPVGTHSVYLPNVVSRKKQIVPLLIKAMQN
jgi:manganese-dependent inorganic pyrophosphatase